jgi:hypothetical protein
VKHADGATIVAIACGREAHAPNRHGAMGSGKTVRHSKIIGAVSESWGR